MGQYNGGMGRFGWKRKCNEPFMYSLGCFPRMPVTKKVQVRIYNTQNVTCFPGSDWNRCGGTSRVDAEFCAWTTSGSFIQVMDFLSLVILCIVADCLCVTESKSFSHGKELWLISLQINCTEEPCEYQRNLQPVLIPVFTWIKKIYTCPWYTITPSFFRIHLLKLQ